MPREKSVVGVSEDVRHKMDFTATEKWVKAWHFGFWK